MDAKRIAVGLLAEDGAGADDAAPARAILDNHLLAPQLRQRLRDEPMPDVRRGSGRQWHNHLHRARRIGLGRCRSGGGQAEARGSHAGQKRALGEHCGPPRLQMQLCRTTVARELEFETEGSEILPWAQAVGVRIGSIASDQAGSSFARCPLYLQ
jgi:hypothetical protein